MVERSMARRKEREREEEAVLHWVEVC